jgi:predicted CxxxxCH...CXXCH cytochrome family protein
MGRIYSDMRRGRRYLTACGGAFASLAALALLVIGLPGSSLADPYFLNHNSQATGTKYGTWGTGYTCQTCHTNSGSPNIKRVSPTITTPTGARPVIFKKYTSALNNLAGVFGNDQRTVYTNASRNICEVCHHKTKYHQYSSSKITDTAHTEHKSNRRDCTKCHNHRFGFRPPPPGTCVDCHGDPPTDNSQLITDILAFSPSNPGAHQKHYYVLGLNCTTCHNGSIHGLLGNDYMEFGFRVDSVTWPDFNGSITTGTFTINSNATFPITIGSGSAGTTLNRAPNVVTCSIYCHGDNWDSNKTPGTISWVNGPLPACSTSVCHGTTPARPPMPSRTTGAHPRHVGTNQYDCSTCHDTYTTPHMVNGRVKWNLSSQGASATYKGFNIFSTNYTAGSASTSYGTCDSVYCHSNVQSGAAGTLPASSYKQATWGGNALACDSCHGGLKTDAAPMATGNHAKHISTYSFACTDCHTGAGKTVETKHADHNIDVAMSASFGGAYTQAVSQPGDGYGSCSATYCHSDGKGTTVTVPWGGTTLACNACHKSDLASGTPITTGMHTQHINQAAVLGTNLGCVECHANTVSSNSAISNQAKHVNVLADYSGLRAGKNKNSCNTAYCHSDGKGTPGIAVSWTTGPALDCKGCHGSDPAPAFTSQAGEPNYANAGVNQPKANSHQRHMGGIGATTCIYCHNNTVDAAGALKTATQHLDGIRGVASGGGRTFNWTPATKTCDNISCHGGPAAVQWGQSLPADCTGCHGGNATSATPQTSGKHAAHMNNTGVLGTNYPCATCHALTVSADRTIADPAYHGNGFKNYTGPYAGGRSSYSTATGICSASYCHTDGKGTQKDMTLTGWKSAATLDCKGCHGSDAAPAFTSSAGEPNYASTGAGTPRANSHQNHVDAGAASCGYCHIATTTNGTSIIGSHTDRTINVNPGNGKSFTWTAAGKTCSNISCHGGVGSFTQTWGAPLTANCLGCHGNNVASGTPIASGRHTAHMNNAAVLGTNYSCTECHAKTINPDERSFAYPANHGNGYKNYSGVRAGRDSTYTTANGVCSASYCHTDGKGTQKMTVSTGWNSGVALDCTGCHGSDAAPAFTSAAGEPNYTSTGANQPRSNSHQKHVGTTGQAATCVFCHGTTVNTAGTAITGNHTDRSINVVQGGTKTFTWTVGTKSCASISCHGTGSPSAQWGQSFPADCTGCHGGSNTSATPVATNQHPAHISNSGVLGSNIGCAACHANTVSSDTVVSNASIHANGLANYSGAMAGKNKAACNAAYCHSDGKGASGIAVSWTTGPAIGCTGCHGAATSPAFTSVAGEPNYANAGAAQPRANSHQTHASAGASTCDTCHTNTVTANGTAIKAGSLHLDRSISVNFNAAKATATWDSLTKTCNNISCHGGANATWGDPNSAGCKVCHGSLSGSHTAHVGNFLDLSATVYGTFSANRSTGTVYRFGCANCHPTDIAKHRNGTVDITLNRNKPGAGYLISLNNLVSTDTAGYTKGGPTNFTCETAYCHSNGRALNLVSGDYRQSPNWYGGPFTGNRCGMCHDNPPQYLGQSHYVAASSINNNGTPPYRDTGHMINIHYKATAKGNNKNGFLGFSSAGDKAHGNPALATTIACYTCHSGIVSSVTIDTYAMNGTSSNFRCGNCHNAGTPTPLQTGQIVNTSLHVNGSKNVAFAPVTFKTKAQVANVNNILGWTRTGGYKASGSYDSFDLSASTWDSQTKTCLTLCHVNQPNITWGAQLKCNSCHAKQ